MPMRRYIVCHGVSRNTGLPTRASVLALDKADGTNLTTSHRIRVESSLAVLMVSSVGERPRIFLRTRGSWLAPCTNIPYSKNGHSAVDCRSDCQGVDIEKRQQAELRYKLLRVL